MPVQFLDEEQASTAQLSRGRVQFLDEEPAAPKRGGVTFIDEQPPTSTAATPATTERGYVSQLGHALVGGLRQAHESVKTTMGAVTGWDQATAEGAAGLATAGRMAQENLSQADVAFNQEMAANAADIEGAKGFWNKAGEWVDYAGIVARNPGAAFKTGVQSAPNALVSIPVMMGGAALGTAAGGAAGLTTGPGAVGTALAGGIAGGTAANTMLESGPAIFENVMEATQGAAKDWTTDQFKAYLSEHPEMVKAGLKSGLKRGAVIGTVDALSAGAGGKVLQMGGKGAGSAVKAGRLAGATALETASEGTGEALAGLADKGKVDSQAVVQEMIGGLATGAPSAMAGAAMIPFASETPDAAGVMTQPPGEGSTPSAGTSQVQQVQPQPTIEPKVPMTPEEVMAAKNRTGTPRPSDGTTIAHEDVDSRMVAAGLVPPEHQHIRWTEETAVAEAATMVKKDPDYAPRLVEFLAENPGVRIAPPQAVILNNHLEQANDLYEKRRDRLQSLPEGHPEREQAKAEMDAAEAAAVKAATVLDTAGSRWGSEGRARQIKRAKELFSTPAGMIAKLQAEEGRDLTAEEKEKIGLAFDRETELLKKRQKIAESLAESPPPPSPEIKEAISKVGKSKRAGAKPGTKSGFDSFIDSQMAAARARLRGQGGKMMATIDPLGLVDHAIIGAGYIAKGVVGIAKWSAKMLGEFGDSIKPHLPALYAASKAQADAWKKDAIAAPTPAEIKASAAPGQPIPQKLVDQLVEHYVQNGETDPRRLIDSVHADLAEINPSQTVADTQNAIGHYGKPVLPDPEPLKVMQRELVALVRKIAQLRDAASGKMPWKSGVQRDNPRERLKEEQRKLRDYLIAHPELQPSDPRIQLSSPRAAVVARLENRIVSLQAQIDGQTKARVERSNVPEDADIKKLRDEIKLLSKKLLEAKAQDVAWQAEQDALWAKNAIKRLGKRVAAIAAQNKAALAGDKTAYDKKAKKERQIAKAKQAEIDKLEGQLLEVQKTKARLQHEIQLSGRTQAQKLKDLGADIVTFSRELMTTLDASGVLRQGRFALGHPILAAKAGIESLTAARSEQGMNEVEARISADPDFVLAKRSKLAITDPSSHLFQKMEEAHQSRWARKIPVLSHFGRLYASYLNVLRINLFKQLVADHRAKNGGAISEGAGKELASLVNMLTGRSNLGKYENAGVVLNTVLFAPKLMLSRLQIATGKGVLYGAKHGTRMAAAKEYARNAAVMAGVYAAYAMLGGQGEDDPRSSEFGKMRFGNTLFDPLGGLSQMIVFLSRMISGETVKNGKVQALRQDLRPLNLVRQRPLHDAPKYGQGTMNAIMQFARSKASPAAGFALDVASGQDYSGQRLDFGINANNRFLKMFQPMPIQDYRDLWGKSNLPTAAKAAASVPMFFGEGVKVYEPRPIRNK